MFLSHIGTQLSTEWTYTFFQGYTQEMYKCSGYIEKHYMCKLVDTECTVRNHFRKCLVIVSLEHINQQSYI